MSPVPFKVNGASFEAEGGLSVREALNRQGIYVPGLCSHPDLDAFKPFHWSKEVWQGEKRSVHAPTDDNFPHCNLCIVSINDSEPLRSCDICVAEGMDIRTESPAIMAARREALKIILARHPHACLTCAQRHGCDRIQCSMNVPVSERCCELLGRCEIGAVAEWIGIPGDTPAYRNEGRPSLKDEPLFIRDYELCIGCTRCVRVCRDVRGVDVLGAAKEGGSAVVGTRLGPTLEESLCRFCGACVEVCPTGALRDHPGARPLVGELAPCSARCPLEIDVPGYLGLIADGLEFDALELIREKAVLPGVLGYACFHPCEENCRRSSLDQPASICALKRYVSDVAGEQPPVIRKAPPTGKRVAVIGSGPAGLAAAAELLRLGHDVTLFERDERLGGMLRQTLPDFRLPDEVIDRDIRYILDLGLKVETGREFGGDVTTESLGLAGFDAVVAALGLGAPAKLNVEGEDDRRVIPGLEVLRTAAGGAPVRLDGRVAVIGGGAVAVDAAMVARRMGASRVTMICLEGAGEMPAHREELRFAAEEGIEILNSWGVSRIEPQDGGLTIRLKRCIRVFDDRGRFSPEFDEAACNAVEAEWVVPAIGQRREGVAIESGRQEWVFIAGDLARGPSSIVEAMADGRRIALEVDRFLGGQGEESSRKEVRIHPFIGRDENFHLRKRADTQIACPAERIGSMQPFISGMTADQARSEAARCLKCHLRATLAKAYFPPDPWNVFEPDLASKAPPVEGVLIFADDAKQTIRITGSPNLHKTLTECFDDGVKAAFCRWEVDPMFTKRESELIQAHLQTHGAMPGGDDLDDLF